MAKLRKHDYTMDGSEWDLSLLSLNEAPVDQLVKNPKARRIDLSQNFFTKLPTSFTSLTHLIELDLSKNRLTELPEDFGKLTKLVKLDLYGNRLTTLPLSFGQLYRLKWLDLKGNPLDSNLAKYAGDCANHRQCEVCALNCIRFMKSEKIRVEKEMKEKEEKLKLKLEFEKQIEDKNKKEKERKKAKNARRSARKAQQRPDLNEDIIEETNDSDSEQKTDNNQKKSFGRKIFSFIISTLRLLLFLSFLLLILLMGTAIGLHLQNGHKLETIEDIKIALNNLFKNTQNYEHFLKETTLLIGNIVKSIKNWKIVQVFNDTINQIKN